MALVAAGHYSNVIEAGLAKARLDAENIPSILFDTNMSWAGTAVPVRLMVDGDDLETALEILSDQPSQRRSGPKS